MLRLEKIDRIRKEYDASNDEYINNVVQYNGFFNDSNNVRIFSLGADLKAEDILQVHNDTSRWAVVTEVRNAGNHYHCLTRRDETGEV